MTVKRKYKHVKHGRSGLKYLEAVQDARLKLLDGYAPKDAVAYAIKKWDLDSEQAISLAGYISQRGGICRR